MYFKSFPLGDRFFHIYVWSVPTEVKLLRKRENKVVILIGKKKCLSLPTVSLFPQSANLACACASKLLVYPMMTWIPFLPRPHRENYNALPNFNPELVRSWYLAQKSKIKALVGRKRFDSSPMAGRACSKTATMVGMGLRAKPFASWSKVKKAIPPWLETF